MKKKRHAHSHNVSIVTHFLVQRDKPDKEFSTESRQDLTHITNILLNGNEQTPVITAVCHISVIDSSAYTFMYFHKLKLIYAKNNF